MSQTYWKRLYQVFSGVMLVGVSGLLLIPTGLNSQELSSRIACPADLKTLIELMLPDLPGYANRVIQRSRSVVSPSSPVNLTSYVIVTGRAEFEPIPLKNKQYTPFAADSTEQVFFTTLDRQYSRDRATDLQNFYWLFLTPTESGWRLVNLYSQLASLHSGDPPLPSQEVSNGIIGQAIRLWLRDCYAGALRTRSLRKISE
jgi:hypothetical protein